MVGARLEAQITDSVRIEMQDSQNQELINLFMKIGNGFRDSLTIMNMATTQRFCLYVNKVFSNHTGYSAAESVGRNLSFLQGPLTDQDVVAFMRAAFSRREACCVDILNYRKNGTPFINRLVMVPIVEDNTLFYLGFQNIIKELATARDVQRPISSNASLRHVVNNLLGKLVSQVEIGIDDKLGVTGIIDSCKNIFLEINQFCLDAPQPRNSGSHNPFL